jgi:uncharacterized membrane protein YdjX (TVP38/TMEM64 family)
MVYESSFCSRKFNQILRRKIEIINIALILILISLGIIGLLYYGFFDGEITSEILLYGKIGIFLGTALLEFIPNFLNPYLILLVAVPIFGVSSSLFIIILGSSLGSILGFEIGKKLGNNALYYFFEDRTIKKIFSFWNKYGKWFVSISAITPLPYFPIAFGLLGLSRRDFWIYGILVRVLSFILVGYAADLGFSFIRLA